MYFPAQMIDATRWMVRPVGGKQPISAHETRPIEYEPPDGSDDPNPSYWRWRWATPSVLSTYEQARSYSNRHTGEIEGLTFVIHPFGNHTPKLRLICLDWDKSLDEHGRPDKGVEEYIELFGSFTEYSRSWVRRADEPKLRYGLHTFLLVEDCPAFANLLKQPVSGCRVDVLCANPVAVTGEVFSGYDELITVPFSCLQKLPFFEFAEPKRANAEKPDWWTDDPLDGVPDHLHEHIAQMEMCTAVEGEGGSLKLFAAACHLMRHGVVGREAEALLRCVPAEPPFPPEQIQRAIECAYNQTTHDGEFNTHTPEFASVGSELSTEDKQYRRYGFSYVSVEELATKDLTLKYLVDGALVGEGSLFIGGRDKTFKTGVAADLLVSMSSRTKFLNHFDVLEERRSAFFTAEIGQPSIKRLLQAVCVARGMTIYDLSNLDIVDTVPTFNPKRGSSDKDNNAAMMGLAKYFQDRQPQVAVFDPLYFCMGGVTVGDMYEVGAVLNIVTGVCREWHVWPIFCHHAKKNAEKEFEPMDLPDFYGSGIGAFARQWVLLSHSEPFRHGVANLYCNIGGSTQGSRGLWHVTIDEGQPDEISDRTWNVETKPVDSDGGLVSKADVREALEGFDKPQSIRDIAFMLNGAPESLIEKSLRELVKDGEVSMSNKKFSLSDGEF